MPKTMQFSKVIAIEPVENSLKVPLFVAPWESVLVQVSPHRVGADIHELKAADSLAPHIPPRMSLFPVVPELIEDGRFLRAVLVEDEKAVVDRPSWAPLEFPIIHALQECVESRYKLFKSLAYAIDLASDYAGVSL